MYLGVSAPPDQMAQIRDLGRRVCDGLYVMPVDLPGFTFRASLNSRKALREALSTLCAEDMKEIAAGVRFVSALLIVFLRILWSCVVKFRVGAGSASCNAASGPPAATVSSCAAQLCTAFRHVQTFSADPCAESHPCQVTGPARPYGINRAAHCKDNLCVLEAALMGDVAGGRLLPDKAAADEALIENALGCLVRNATLGGSWQWLISSFQRTV